MPNHSLMWKHIAFWQDQFKKLEMKNEPLKLNGYYGEDFDEKQTVIKELLIEKKVTYEQLDLLMDGTLDKFCMRINEGSYVWTCWNPKFHLDK